ncbi:MAG TPA: UvrD-helicase domain-containing protein [Longimicrobiaceae bacterium]|nr:UvrD-helicase domain-containing protein [Longimicrobiaceae bacterium]
MTSPAPAPPRELVRASAGTGKTFRISSDIVGLLAAGSRPDAIFASTFTRKAAGEILDRVLVRVAAAALDERRARELAAQAVTDRSARGEFVPERWLSLLRELTAELHRLNVGTLDAFFVRAASSFSDEIALPAGWGIADRSLAERVKAEALQSVLEEADAGELIELVRGLGAKDAARSVHDALLRQSDDLLRLHRSLDPAAADAWASFDRLAASAPTDLDQRRERLAEAFAAVDAPLTQARTPNSAWVKALDAIARMLREGDWDGLIESGLFQRALQEDSAFGRVPIPEEVRALAAETAGLVRPIIARRLSLQCRAMGRLSEHLARAMDEAQRAAGAYGFGDVTRLLGGPGAPCSRADLFYRLDARVQHVLLDEFQDTSLSQWEALEPLLDRLLLERADGHAALVVADPKQSIYGWRGGEPLLVERVGERYGLREEELSRSWRSSQVVLDLVNRVFEVVEENEILDEDEAARAAACEWARAFVRHTAAKDLPGHVRVTTGPRDEGPGESRPRLCRRAAELVAELRARAPGRYIGVLTRKNSTVARIILELRDLGIRASEEGGNPLTDSAAVAAVISLLRLADHPGDRVARYHVARTPLGPAVGLVDHDDAAAAERCAERLRRQLLEEGYGRTIEGLARRIRNACGARDRRRMGQLVDLGFRCDSRATLRPTDFVSLVGQERVEDPTAADVRVMTVHQSKGLEFDVVVLPELDVPLSGRGGEPVTYRPHPAGRATRVFPYVSDDVRALFPDVPELHRAVEQAAAARWRDGLSGLYVALTRARHALHVLVKPEGMDRNGKLTGSRARSAARLVRCALGVEAAADADQLLYESGDPRWFDAAERAEAGSAEGGERGDGPPAGPILLAAAARGGKTPAQVTPSSLAGGDRVDLGLLLRLDRSAAERGTLAHAWLERIGWLEDGVPSSDEMRTVAARVSPLLPADAVAALQVRFRGWLATPAVRYLLRRDSYPADAVVEREVPFFHRAEGRLVEGIIDRLVVVRRAGRVVSAEVIDYKTDALQPDDSAAIAAKAVHYRPQLDAYRAAVASSFGIAASAVCARLVFLEAGAVTEV